MTSGAATAGDLSPTDNKPGHIQAIPAPGHPAGLGAIPFLRYAVGPAMAQLQYHTISPSPVWRRGMCGAHRPGYLLTGVWGHTIITESQGTTRSFG